MVEGEARDYLTDNPVRIEKIELNNGVLIASLSNTPNNDWQQLYVNSLSQFTYTPVCYRNFKFWGNQARYKIGDHLQYGNSNQLVEALVKDFKQAVENTNQIYAQRVIAAYQKRRQQEIACRQAEIARLENENMFNDFLKGLL